MRILLTILPILFCGLQVHSQEKLDSLQYVDVPATIRAYQQLENEDLRVEQYLLLAGFYGQLQKMDSAFYYLDKIWDVDSTFYEIGILVKTNLYFVLDDTRWDAWIQRFLNNYSSKIKPILNYEYCKALTNIRIKDASFYKTVYYSESQNGKYSPTTIALWELKKQISKDNISQLDDLIKKWGWPQFSEYGSFASMAFLVIQHADLETQKRYLPIITDAYNQGEAYFNWVAMLTDRILLREGNPQTYGSQSIWNPHIGKYVLYQVEDVQKMNELRIKHKIGEPISDEIIRNMYKPEE